MRSEFKNEPLVDSSGSANGKTMERTPGAGKSQEELVDRARRMALRYAQVSPYRLNPDQDIWEGIVRAIGRNAYTFGWPYCP